MMDQEFSAPILASPDLRSLQDDLRWVGGMDVPVLISGEVGVGKRRIARCVHALGERRHHPFHTVDCTQGPESRLESELPRWLRGGTDLTGTLYLHEVSELGPGLQTELLRALGREVRRVRIIAGTSQDLFAATDDTFSRELFYRLNVVHLVIPPLREYREEIPGILVGNAVLEQEALRLGVAFVVKSVEAAHLRRIADEALSGHGPKPWTGIRLWQRKHLGGLPDAEVVERTARLQDVSYGGIGFEVQGLAHDLPQAFEITIPEWGLSLAVRAVWQKRDVAGAVWCGASLSQAQAKQEPMWRTLVDQAKSRSGSGARGGEVTGVVG